MPKLISIKILCNYIEVTLRHGCSPVNLLHIFRTPFTKNTSGSLLLGSFAEVIFLGHPNFQIREIFVKKDNGVII